MSSSSSERLVIVHDVLGTLFGLEAPIEALQSIFAEQLKAMNAPAILAELIIMVRLMTLLVAHICTKEYRSIRTGIMQLKETLPH
jgi:hypothetical protein